MSEPTTLEEMLDWVEREWGANHLASLGGAVRTVWPIAHAAGVASQRADHSNCERIIAYWINRADVAEADLRDARAQLADARAEIAGLKRSMGYRSDASAAFYALETENAKLSAVVEAAREIHSAYHWLCEVADQTEQIHGDVQQRFADLFAALAALDEK